MPSGAKKRKAAKKKKEMEEANHSSASHSHGDDDCKIHDEKESDGGDVSSPASDDHHNHQHPFTEGDDEEEMVKREDTPDVQSIVTENEPVAGANGIGESTQKAAMEESGVIQIDWKFEPEDDSDSKNASVKKSHGESSSSSSTGSSSDDESHVVEKNIVVIEPGESKEDAPHSVEETVAFADSVKTDDADLPEATQVTDGVPLIDAYDVSAGEPKEEADDPVAANRLSIDLVKPVDLPEPTQAMDGIPVIEAYSFVVEKISNSVVETIPLVDSEDVSKEVVHLNDCPQVENPKVFSVCELGLKENGKTESSEVAPVVMDVGSQAEEEKVSSIAIGCSAVSSVAMGSRAEEDEGKPVPSSSVPAVVPSNGTEHGKDSVVTECSDSQALVDLAPRPVQATSWKSCCGLFELFTGFNR